MWMSERLAGANDAQNNQGIIERGADGYFMNSGKFSEVSGFIAPYGWCSAPPEGSNAAAISINGENFCIGSLSVEPQISDGEIMIKSSGGACIRLLNDGTICLNGLIIEKNGSIRQPQN